MTLQVLEVIAAAVRLYVMSQNKLTPEFYLYILLLVFINTAKWASS